MVVISQLLSVVFLAILGGIVWRQRPSDPVNRGFLFLTLSLNLWVLSGILSNIDTGQALLINKIVFVFPLILVWSATDLAIKLSNGNTRLSKIIGFSVLVASIVTVFTNIIVNGVIARFVDGSLVRYDIERGIGYYFYIIYLVTISLIALATLFIRLRKTGGREKEQLLIVVLGLLLCLISGLLTSVVIPNITGSSEAAGFSFISGVIVTLSFALAIVKYNLFDIRFAAFRTVVYALSLLSLAGIYSFLAYLVSLLLFHGETTNTISFSPINIVLAIILAFIFQPVKLFFDKVTDKIFYRQSYNTEVFFGDLSKLLTTTTDLKSLLERSSREIAETFKAQQASFHLHYTSGTGQQMSVGTHNHVKLQSDDVKLLDGHMAHTHASIIRTEYMSDRDSKIQTMLRENKIEMVMPLRQAENVIGYLLIGEHLSGNYTKRDINVLLTISNQLVIAIQNTLSLHKVRELNGTLRERVDVATDEVRSSNGELGRVNQEMYVRNLQLAQTNKTLSLLRTIDKLVLEADGSTAELCKAIVYEIAQTTSYPFTAILAKDQHKANTLEVYGWNSGVSIDNVSHAFLDDMTIPEDQISLLESDDESVTMSIAKIVKRRRGFSSTHDGKHFIKIVESMGVKSLYTIKLEARGRLVGLMIVGLVSEKAETGVASNDQDLMARLGGAIGIALDNKLLQEENVRIVNQLQHTNEKLKALDETKDEFISMASHQLRTPLTSIKGYVSMVMEGDAGRITPQQQKLLGEAFKSSERMVGLIADFLNVSRLQTGKFLIEKAPFDLKQVVKDEIEDLDVIAEGHSIKLKLKTDGGAFPVFADESKMRQVIMNFVDNAIYYSKADSTIVVNLERVKGAAALTVVDTGIGVPKAEQTHLFTKFFRAVNARKQRPDGTGVGLFLARKVIDEHDGDIIFSSTEGKGSTFGFKIPLEAEKEKSKKN